MKKNEIVKSKKIRCKICDKYFIINLEGRTNFYTNKYCSDECKKNAIKIQSQRMLDNQKKALQHIKERYKNYTGKINKTCKNCKNKYFVYVSQVRARGSNFCSLKCRKEYKSNNPTLKNAKKNAWNSFSKFIRLRDAIRTTKTHIKAKCITCNKEKEIKYMDAGHLFSRTISSILFDEYNVNAQCKECNMPPNNGEQYIYSQKIIELFGEYEFNRLLNEKNNNRIVKRTIQDYINIKNKYDNKFKELSK